jgi:tRNA A37 methylthiotransferase MiaB
MEVTSDADEADVLIVNTCAFIDSAKEESIEAISRRASRPRTQEAEGTEADRQRLHGPAFFQASSISECPRWMHSSVSTRSKDTPRIIERVSQRLGPHSAGPNVSRLTGSR